MKSIADNLARVVKLSTLDMMRERAMGMSAAKIADSQIPKRLYLCSLLTVYTIIIPIRLRATTVIIHMM